MPEMTRRNVLTLGAALGLTSVIAPTAAWSWSPSRSIIGSGSGVDPQWVWDDELDAIMAAVIQNGQVPAVNSALSYWVNNDDPLPMGLPTELHGFLQRSNRLPEWADMAKLRRAADFNRRRDLYLFMIYGIGGGIMSTVIPREGKSVYWSKGGADMQDRAAKTFTFGYDLTDRNAFEPDGQMIVTGNKTRMVHAAVRHLLPQSPYWKAVADESIPISGHHPHRMARVHRLPRGTQPRHACLVHTVRQAHQGHRDGLPQQGPVHADHADHDPRREPRLTDRRSRAASGHDEGRPTPWGGLLKNVLRD